MADVKIPSGFSEFKAKNMDCFPEGTPIETQIVLYERIVQKRNRDQEQKRENFQKLDRAVEKKSREISEAGGSPEISTEKISDGDPWSLIPVE
jgi:hypothetical protein